MIFPPSECALSGEDALQSDSRHQPSDSEGTLTPASHDAMGTHRNEDTAKDADRWEVIKSEMQRVELSRDRLPRRMDISQSPGTANAMGNFRQKMGMNESGPVMPFTHGTRLDATTAAPGGPPSGMNPPVP